MKKLPIGLHDFKEIISDGYYFIDKTTLIREIWDDTNVLLITRPRRFGKTLNMSMLKYFFDNREDNISLFEKFDIYNDEEMMKLCGKIPVIFLSFRGCDGISSAKTKNLIAQEIKREVHQFKFIKDNLDVHEREEFDELMKLTSDSNILEKSISILCHLIRKSTGIKPILLIDEYDNPINNSYFKGFYKEIIDFLRPIYSNALKDNSNIQKAVLTGVMRVSKESIFSGLNNLLVYGVNSERYSNKFGFIKEEVETLLNDFDVNYKIDDVKSYYNGYNFCKTEIFNPWSILNYVKSQKEVSGLSQTYWMNTSGNDIIKTLLINNSKDFTEDLELLLKGESIKKKVNENVSFDSLDINPNNIWSIFLTSGYLTVAAVDERSNAYLKIPNKEVKTIYEEVVLDYVNTRYDMIKYEDLVFDLLDGKLESFSKEFKRLVEKTMSYFDKTSKNPENFYHGFVLGLFALIIDKYDIKYEIKSNRETGRGRADISIIPKDLNNKGVILEFKVAASYDELEKEANDALNQIETLKYVREMELSGIKEVLKVGVAFYGKEVEIKF